MKLRLPPFMDAGDIGAGIMLLAFGGVVLVAASAVFGLAWAVFRLFGGL